MAKLSIKDNKAYTLGLNPEIEQMDTECIQDGYGLEAQVRLGKDSIGKVSTGKDRLGENDAPSAPRTRFTKPTIEEVRAYCFERGNSVDAQHWFDYYEANGWKVGKNPMKDWKATIRTWERNGYDSKRGSGNTLADRLHSQYEMMNKWAEDET